MMSKRQAAWVACWAFVPLVAVATAAVEGVPHVRGIGFVTALRYAVLTPACAVAALASAFLYRSLKKGSARPRLQLGLFLIGAAAAALVLVGAAGPAGLFSATAPVVFVSAVTLWLLVPRLAERPRPLLGSIAMLIFAALAAGGVVLAIESERPAPA